MRSEIRTTNYFYMNNKRYRLSYTSRGHGKQVTIQLNQPLYESLPAVHRIILLRHYGIIRLVINQKYIPENMEEALRQCRGIAVEYYAFRAVYCGNENYNGNSTAADGRPYIPLCVYERVELTPLSASCDKS